MMFHQIAHVHARMSALAQRPSAKPWVKGGKTRSWGHWNSAPLWTFFSCVVLGAVPMASCQAPPLGPTKEVVRQTIASIMDRFKGHSKAASCNWTLPHAPKTFYIPPDQLKKSECAQAQLTRHMPAVGYRPVEDPAKALWVLTGAHFQAVSKTVQFCKQQLVQGLPFRDNKRWDAVGLRRLGTRHPWTQAHRLLPLTYDVGSAEGCAAWEEKMSAWRNGPAPGDPDAPAWVLKRPHTHWGVGVRFLSWNAVGRINNVSRFCEEERDGVVQEMVRSTTAFRGGSVFSLRVMALVTSLAPVKLIWSKTRAGWMLFADRPSANRTGLRAKYVTNSHARDRLENPEHYNHRAVPEFDRVRAGMWEDCIAPQLKVALVAYILHVLRLLRTRESNWFNHFGCDFLIDENFMPRLLECNQMPGCAHRKMASLYEDVYTLVWNDALRHNGVAGGRPFEASQDYEVLIDEAQGYAFTLSHPRPQHCSQKHPSGTSTFDDAAVG